jgi:hypothetical protein
MNDILRLCETKEKDYVLYDIDRLKHDFKSDIVKLADRYTYDSEINYPDGGADSLIDNWIDTLDKNALVQWKVSTHVIKSWKAKVTVGGNTVILYFNVQYKVFMIHKYESSTSSLILRIPETPVACLGVSYGVLDTKKDSPYSEKFYDIKHINYQYLENNFIARQLLHEISEIQCMSLASNRKMIKVNTTEIAKSIRYVDSQSLNYDMMCQMVKIKAFDEVTKALIEPNDRNRILILINTPSYLIRMLENSYLYKCIKYLTSEVSTDTEQDVPIERLSIMMKSRFNSFMMIVQSTQMISDCRMQVLNSNEQPLIRISVDFLNRIYEICDNAF